MQRPYQEKPMTKDDLGLTLDSLHNSLADSPQIDAQTAEKLRMLIGDIQLAISRSESATDSAPLHENLTQRVQAMVSDFEAHYPKLTSNLSYVAERLADMGI